MKLTLPIAGDNWTSNIVARGTISAEILEITNNKFTYRNNCLWTRPLTRVYEYFTDAGFKLMNRKSI